MAAPPETWARAGIINDARRGSGAPASIRYCYDCDGIHLVCRPCSVNVTDPKDPRWAEAVQYHLTHKEALEALIAHQIARHPEMKP